MHITLDKYRDIVGDKPIDNIYSEASPLSEKHIVHVNSTYYGGGVAEILNSLIMLMNQVGIPTGWRLFKGNPDFFNVTKKIHNALQGASINLSKMKKRVYLECNELNSFFTHIGNHDCVIVHDPQPLPMITFYKKKQPWIWRCHLDISHPNEVLWDYLKTFLLQYDMMIVSMDKFKHGVNIPQRVIRPSIDPLSYKNKRLIERRINETLSDHGIKTDKPIISQVSRFDKWKDPLGVIKAYSLIKKKVDCRLVLLGSMATDDPEGQKLYEKVVKVASRYKDVLVINYESDILVNALQRVSSVVIQKSLKEGFALTVSEALWKGTPVVGGNVGGIPAQIKNGKNGYLVNSIQQCASRVIKILKNPDLMESMGAFGHEYVRNHFLITRHLLDYIILLKKVFRKK
jgi:trehalose synthase